MDNETRNQIILFCYRMLYPNPDAQFKRLGGDIRNNDVFCGSDYAGTIQYTDYAAKGWQLQLRTKEIIQQQEVLCE